MNNNFKPILTLVLILSLAILLIECSGFNYQGAVLTQDGFDFSEGISDTENQENNDGRLTRWSPGEPNPDYPSQSAFLWFYTDGTPNKTKDMGQTKLSSIMDISGIVWDTIPPPLLVGHSVVIGCKDGYAKIKVIATNTAAPWRAYVHYYYSDVTYFDH